MVGLDDQRRQEGQDVTARPGFARQHAGILERFEDAVAAIGVGRIVAVFDGAAEHQAAPAGRAEARVGMGEVGEALPQLLAPLRGCVGQFMGFVVVEHREGGCRAHRVASVGRCAGAGVALGDGVGRDEGSDGEAVAERFAHGHQVGHDAFVIRREPPAGAAEAGLDLVEDQEDAVVIAESADRRPVPMRRDHDAAVALDGFGDHRGDVAAVSVEVSSKRFEVAKWQVIDVAEGVGVGPPHGGAGDVHRPAGSAVQAVVHRHDAAAAGVQCCREQSALDGFGAAGGEEATAEVAGGHLGQPLGEAQDRLGEVDAGGVLERAELGDRRFEDRRV